MDYTLEPDDTEESARHGGTRDCAKDDDAEKTSGVPPCSSFQKLTAISGAHLEVLAAREDCVTEWPVARCFWAASYGYRPNWQRRRYFRISVIPPADPRPRAHGCSRSCPGGPPISLFSILHFINGFRSYAEQSTEQGSATVLHELSHRAIDVESQTIIIDFQAIKGKGNIMRLFP